MPTYDLSCHDCGHRFEKFVMRILRDGDAQCPECGSSNLVRGVGGGILAGIRTVEVTPSTGCGSGGFS